MSKITIVEQVDYKTQLIKALDKVQESILLGDHEITQNSIWILYNMIPSNWKDQQFHEEVKKAFKKRRVDVRPEFCGLRASEAWCEKRGITHHEEEDMVDHFMLLAACVDLLERLGVLMRRTSKQLIIGKSGVVIPDGEGLH